MNRWQFAGLTLIILVAVTLLGCASSSQYESNKNSAAQQDRQERIQQEHRSASERLDRQVD